jgi:hypothetical protein
VKNSSLLVKCSKIGTGAAAAAILAFSGCNSSSNPPPSAGPCAGLQSCSTNASSSAITFPDGDGGTVACTGGACVVSNTQTNAYNTGNTAGYNAAYNSGESDGYNDGYNDGYTAGYDSSIGTSTKDTDLQKAGVQTKSLEQRAQFIANQFSMSVGAATQLTQLSDRVKQMAVSGRMTSADRVAVTQSALGIAGLSTDQVNDAITRMNSGDESAASALMQKAAVNLGMPSSAALRDKLLPALGVTLD